MRKYTIFFLNHLSCYINSLADALSQMGHTLYYQSSWNMKEIEAGIAYAKPELLITVGIDKPMFDPALDMLPALCRKYKVCHLYWATEDRIHFDKISKPYITRTRPDYVWTIHPACVEKYRQLGIRADYVNFAFNPRWFAPKTTSMHEPYDVAFVGTTHLETRTFRYDSLKQLVFPLIRDGVNAHVWGHNWLNSRASLEREFGASIPPQWIHGFLPYKQTAEVYRQSKIVLGVQNAEDQVTQRTFEILGTGAFMIASRTAVLEQLFEEGREIVFSSGPEETVSLVKYYLAHTAERLRIGRQARRKVLEQHTFERRLEAAWPALDAFLQTERKLGMIELVPLVRQFQSMKQEIMQATEETIDSGKFILGPSVQRLEQEICAYLGVEEAIGVANGTDALVLALEACGIGPGDEVVTSPFTFFASAEAISRVGATPVFADIDPVTYNLDPAELEKKLTPATKAVIPVHLFGQPADMDAIMAIAERHGLLVIEDACQAFGADYRGRRAGSFGHAACFSFFPTKNLGTVGDGGLIVTSDPALAARIRLLRQHGSRQKYYHEAIGYNSRLDELHAAILRIALPRIDAWNAERSRLAQRYRAALGDLSWLEIDPPAQDRTHIYHLFCLRTKHRDKVQETLAAHGIQSGVYYPLPLHLQRAYASLGYAPGDFPVSERLSTELLALPMSPFLYESEQDEVIDALRSLEGALTP